MDRATPPELPQTCHRTLARASMVLCVVAIVMTIVTATLLSITRTEMLKVYEDFDMELPVLTNSVFRITPIMMAVGATVLAVGLIAKELLIQSKSMTLYINIAALIAVMAIFAGGREAMIGPIYRMLLTPIG